MTIRTLNMYGVVIGEVFEAEDGRKGLELLEENWIDMLFIRCEHVGGEWYRVADPCTHQTRDNDLPVLIISTEKTAAGTDD